MRGCLELVLCSVLLFARVNCLPPNFEDEELSIDQPVDEVVNIVQEDPHSNNIHIGHNNPKNSDIKVEQSNPFNTTIHISLNVGTGSKVAVKLTNARNVQLHISFNGMGNSECNVEIDKAFNTTVHLSFQNPSSTPVTVTMNRAEISSLLVSQNIPRNSPMVVTMEEAKNCQIHLSQSVPMSSPLTWKLTGDPAVNQIGVAQNAADSASPLDCTPECPQEEYVYDYQYADSAHSNVQPKEVAVAPEEDPAVNEVDFVDDTPDKVVIEEYDSSAVSNTGIDTGLIFEEASIPALPLPNITPAPALPPSTPRPASVPASSRPTASVPESPKPPASGTATAKGAATASEIDAEDYTDAEVGQTVCPGGGLEACVDVCPGHFGPRVFGACVTSCGNRCP